MTTPLLRTGGDIGKRAGAFNTGPHQIEGDIRTREYTAKASGKKSDSVKKSITEIRVTSITKLDRPSKGTDSSDAEGAAA